MSLAVLEKQMRELPLEAQLEVAHYVAYLISVYKSKKTEDSVSKRINAFIKKNPSAFDEFASVNNTGLEAIRKLTENDSW